MSTERLWVAVDALVGENTIQERLKTAFLAIHPLPERSFPEKKDMHFRFKRIIAELSTEVTFEETLDLMSDEKALAVARDIVNLYGDMCEHEGNHVG